MCWRFAGSWNERDLKQEITTFLQQHPELPIEWVGEVKGEQKYQLLADSDAFVFPSYYPPEGHPWVIVEAMAAGLPIVSTDQGAIRESVIDGHNGFLVNKQDPPDVARRVRELATDDQLRKTMGRRSRQRYEQEFTESRMVQRMTAAFAQAVDAKAARPTAE